MINFPDLPLTLPRVSTSIITHTILLQLGSLPALTFAAIALVEFNLIPPEVIRNNTSSASIQTQRHKPGGNGIDPSGANGQPFSPRRVNGIDLTMAIHGVTVFVIITASSATVLEAWITLTRICNVAFINSRIKIFLIFVSLSDTFLTASALGG